MKLFEVEIKVNVVVEALDKDDADRKSANITKEILASEDIFEIDVVREIANTNDLPYLWDDSCIPYGGNENKRIHEILDV